VGRRGRGEEKLEVHTGKAKAWVRRCRCMKNGGEPSEKKLLDAPDLGILTTRLSLAKIDCVLYPDMKGYSTSYEAVKCW